MAHEVNVATNGILAMLKTYYAKEGLVNLLYRNDPLLKDIKKERVEGKEAAFSALYSRGGAVSANYQVAKRLATQTAQAKEFKVIPGQLFSGCTFNNKELLASKTLKGAYINVASAKFFANAESFRKTLAVALYGSGHGELFVYASDAADTIPVTAADGEVEFTFPKYAIMGIDIMSELEVKDSPDATSVSNVLTVTKIEGTTVTAKIKTAVTGSAFALAGKAICLAGCTDIEGNPMLPIGLEGWLPSGTVGSDDSFFGVNRSIARDRLAGTVITAESGEKKYEAIERAIMAVRVTGGIADKIVMNNEDFIAMGKELEAKTYLPRTGKTKGQVGYEGFGFAVSTSWVDNVIDSPYCPKGKAYVLSSDTIAMWTLTNADKVNDGISGNDEGKPDVTGETDVQDKPYQLLVDDMFTVTPGADTEDGAAAYVALNFYGQFVVTSPASNAVVLF